jgi:hypothetical protein
MVCFRYTIVNTLHKGGNKDTTTAATAATAATATTTTTTTTTTNKCNTLHKGDNKDVDDDTTTTTTTTTNKCNHTCSTLMLHTDNVYVLIQIFLGNTVHIYMKDPGHQDYQISLVSL